MKTITIILSIMFSLTMNAHSPLAGKCYASDGGYAMVYYFTADGFVEYDSQFKANRKQVVKDNPYDDFLSVYRQDGAKVYIEMEWTHRKKTERRSHKFRFYDYLHSDNSWDMKECDCLTH